jgi:hypothetical protein
VTLFIAIGTGALIGAAVVALALAWDKLAEWNRRG